VPSWEEFEILEKTVRKSLNDENPDYFLKNTSAENKEVSLQRIISVIMAMRAKCT
jgi:hypothetical protein